MSPEFNLKKKHYAFVSKNFKWQECNGETILIDVRERNRVCNPGDAKTKIAIYEDRVNGWFLDVGDSLQSNSNAEFVILQIAISYIEGNQQLRDGNSSEGRSKGCFVNAMKRIFALEDLADEDARTLYEEVRCGLFHDGIPSKKVLLSCDFEKAIKHVGEGIYINARLFFNIVKADFCEYIRSLEKSEPVLLKNFEKMFYFGQEEA